MLAVGQSNRPEELEDLKLDQSKISRSEKERLDFIQKLSLEADEMVKAAGFSMDGEQDDDEIDRAIRDTDWSGQSNVEETRVSQRNFGDLSSRPGLVFGDTLALFAFATIGRNSHNEGVDVLGIISTAAPFVLSWLAMSPFLGAYTRKATASQTQLASGLLLSWAVSMPVALAVRGALKGAVPPVPFIGVSMVATFALLYLWRTLYIKAFGNTSDDEYKSAGFMEVFKMVGTLIKRW